MTNKAIFEVYAVKQREKNYSICDFDKNWYSGFGTSPVAKGHYVEIEWEQNGDFKNITKIVPAAFSPAATPTSQAKPVQSSVSGLPDTQTLIVRQSCLKAAVELANIYGVSERESSVVKIKEIAEDFEKWVMRE